jgi:hypothetical protein
MEMQHGLGFALYNCFLPDTSGFYFPWQAASLAGFTGLLAGRKGPLPSVLVAGLGCWLSSSVHRKWPLKMGFLPWQFQSRKQKQKLQSLKICPKGPGTRGTDSNLSVPGSGEPGVQGRGHRLRLLQGGAAAPPCGGAQTDPEDHL